MTLLKSMMIMDISDGGWCSGCHFGLPRYDLRKVCLKCVLNLLSLKAWRTLSKIMTLLELLLESKMIRYIPDLGCCPWWHLNIKTACKGWWHCWSCCWSLLGLWTFLIETGILVDVLYCLHICSKEALFNMWLKSVKDKGVKNSFKEWWHCWNCWWNSWVYECSALGLEFLMMVWLV